MSALIPGDPASISAAAATAARVAQDIKRSVGTLRTAYGAVGASKSARESRQVRKEAEVVATSLADIEAALRAGATLLQEHAGVLAAVAAELRSVAAAAADAGCVIEHGTVVPAWGITGEADADARDRQRERAQALQHDVHRLRMAHRRSRDRLLTSLTESTGSLSTLATTVRLT